MSAASCVIFYGLRYEVSPFEIEKLETRSDERVAAARKVGLTSYWGNFCAPNERYLLLVGAQIAIIGPENRAEVQISDSEFEAIVGSVRAKLTATGIQGS